MAVDADSGPAERRRRAARRLGRAAGACSPPRRRPRGHAGVDGAVGIRDRAAGPAERFLDRLARAAQLVRRARRRRARSEAACVIVCEPISQPASASSGQTRPSRARPGAPTVRDRRRTPSPARRAPPGLGNRARARSARRRRRSTAKPRSVPGSSTARVKVVPDVAVLRAASTTWRRSAARVTVCRERAESETP